MTTRLIRNKKIESTISLTKSNIFPNHLYLLTNLLLNKKIKIEAECDNGNINILFIRNTYTINRGCWTMQGHNAYNIPTLDERYSFVTAFIQDNCKNQLDNFEVLKKNRTKIYKDFESNKNFNDNTDIKEEHFKYILKNKSRFEFYNYLYENLFKLIIDLENYIANLVRYRFPEFYETFNISLPNIQTDLSFFKTFSVNFSLQEKDQNIRQGATDPHKDDNDCLYSFCVIVVFGNFEGGDLILGEIGIVIKIEGGYVIFLRSALLDHCNSYITKGNRFSIVFYLRKTIFNEK